MGTDWPRHARYDIAARPFSSHLNLALRFLSPPQAANIFQPQVTTGNMGDYKVYIGNIPDDCRERDVEKFFKGFGKIRNIVLKVSVIPPSER